MASSKGSKGRSIKKRGSRVSSRTIPKNKKLRQATEKELLRELAKRERDRVKQFQRNYIRDLKKLTKVDPVKAKLVFDTTNKGDNRWIKKDGSIAYDASSLRWREDVERRLIGLDIDSKEFEEEAYEVAYEYDVDVREVYTLIISP